MKYLPLLLFFVATNLHAPVPIYKLWNELKAESDVWVMLRTFYENNPGISPYEQRKEWDKVRHAFHEVDIAVRNEP